MTSRFAPVLGAFLLLSACRSESSARQQPPPPPNGTKKVQITFDQSGNPVMAGASGTPVAAAAPPSTQVAPPDVKGGLKCDPPTDWKAVQPSSAMRMAQFLVPRTAGDSEDGELALFYFGTSGAGGTDETFQRWTAAFDAESSAKAKRSTRKASGQDVQQIEVAGTFDTAKTMTATGVDGGARKESALLGAILQTTDGPYYFKLTGPPKTIAGARKAFDKFLDSCKVQP